MESVRVRAGNELDFVCCPQVHACMTNRNYRKWRPLGDVQTLGLFQNLIWQRNMRYRTCIMIACVIYPDAAGNLSVCFEYACCCTHVLGVVVGITKLHSLKQYVHLTWYGFRMTLCRLFVTLHMNKYSHWKFVRSGVVLTLLIVLLISFAM